MPLLEAQHNGSTYINTVSPFKEAANNSDMKEKAEDTREEVEYLIEGGTYTALCVLLSNRLNLEHARVESLGRRLHKVLIKGNRERVRKVLNDLPKTYKVLSENPDETEFPVAKAS